MDISGNVIRWKEETRTGININYPSARRSNLKSIPVPGLILNLNTNSKKKTLKIGKMVHDVS